MEIMLAPARSLLRVWMAIDQMDPVPKGICAGLLLAAVVIAAKAAAWLWKNRKETTI